LYRRFCSCERERDDTLKKLESRETELKNLRRLYDTEKNESQKLIYELTQKADRISYELEKANEERLKLSNELTELKIKINDAAIDKDQIQKKLTKHVSSRSSSTSGTYES
jgi:chromosome segregation ATPase